MGTVLSQEELVQHALSFLQSQYLMVLGTSHNDHVWSATVGYVVTSDFELIFYSRPDTLHSQNIQENSRVSVVVTEIPAKKGENISIQIAGEARSADGAEWNTYYPLYEKKVKDAASEPDHIIYVVKPTELWMIDEKQFGHRNRVQVLPGEPKY